MILVCRVTLEDHMIKVLYDFMVRSPLKQVIILPSLAVLYIVVVRYYGF